MRSLRREFGWVDTGVSLVGAHQLPGGQHVTLKDWFRRLGWLGLWLVAQRSMRLWLAAPTFTGSRAIAFSRGNARLVEEPHSSDRAVAVDTTPSARGSCSYGSS
jgi:hypothetical protein